jgi:hypothetical protein
LRGVGDTPDDDRADLDRVADGVVDLDLFARDVVRTQGQLVLRSEGIDPPEATLSDRPAVVAEEDHHSALVRFDDVEADQGQDPAQAEQERRG